MEEEEEEEAAVAAVGLGGCQLRPSGSPLAQGSLLSLEEIQRNTPRGDGDDEDGDDEEDGETQEEEEEEDQGRLLLAYWQGVGRGHRVEVPPDMAEPIQQMTRNNGPQEREKVPFTVISRKEKLGELLYEKRHYGKSKWACVKVQEEQYEQSICLGFMKIMRYICEQNSSGLYLGMTVPIVTVVHTGENAPEITRLVTVAYYLPRALQDRTPEPYDPDIVIEEWPPAIVYARGFRGATNEDSITREITLLAEILESPELCLRDTFIVAGYTNPAAANRQNEIWFLGRP